VPRWDADTKAKAMGAMWASASEYAGTWMPHYALVSERLSVPINTLKRWWLERDVTEDSTHRAAVVRARVTASENGAREWFDQVLKLGQDRVTDLLTERRHVGAEVDASARATKSALEAGILVAGHLGLTGDADAGDGGESAAVVEVRVRGALARVRAD
jgi:predicted esterase